MKKVLIFCMAFLLLVPALFADDAKVMPVRVGRLYLAPSFIFGDQAFDNKGNLKSANSLSMFNLGVVLEYGVISWISAAIQWAPGINIWSEVDAGLPVDTVINDMGDLFVGAKIQVMGSQAPIRTDDYRLAFAPGIKIPMPGPDFKKEMDEDPMTVAKIDNHVLGLGLRTYFDYIINDKFFINFYNEIIYYPMPGKIKNHSPQAYGATLGMDSGNANVNEMAPGTGNLFDYSNKVDYGYDLTFEVEGVYSHNIAENTPLSLSLALNYQTSPGAKFDYSYNKNHPILQHPVAGPQFQEGIDSVNAILDSKQSQLITIKPSVSLFFMDWGLPTEFKLTYFAPVWGMNEGANHTINFQVRAYFRI